MASEEADVADADADDASASFSIYFEVLAGPHGVKEGANGKRSKAFLLRNLSEFPHADDHGGHESFFVGSGGVKVGVATVLA
jgi:hypothetical protein